MPKGKDQKKKQPTQPGGSNPSEFDKPYFEEIGGLREDGREKGQEQGEGAGFREGQNMYFYFWLGCSQPSAGSVLGFFLTLFLGGLFNVGLGFGHNFLGRFLGSGSLDSQLFGHFIDREESRGRSHEVVFLAKPH